MAYRGELAGQPQLAEEARAVVGEYGQSRMRSLSSNLPQAQPFEVQVGLASARGRVNPDLIAFKQSRARAREATLDRDATLIEPHRRSALFSYPGSLAYQPLTVY